MVTIVDYHLGNLGSIQNMLRKLGHQSTITSDPELIAIADRLILPGVGAFDRGMAKLRELNLVDILNYRVLEKRVPVLGICLGAQLMTRRSEEGSEPGLGWVNADTVRFFRDKPSTLPVPAMGWQEIRLPRPHWIFNALQERPRYYFVHSYHFKFDCTEDVIAWSEYGYEFAAAFACGTILGVQFHPEKSHRYGMSLLDAFARGAKSANNSKISD
jgi:glutamine amidotransferase